MFCAFDGFISLPKNLGKIETNVIRDNARVRRRCIAFVGLAAFSCRAHFGHDPFHNDNFPSLTEYWDPKRASNLWDGSNPAEHLFYNYDDSTAHTTNPYTPWSSEPGLHSESEVAPGNNPYDLAQHARDLNLWGDFNPTQSPFHSNDHSAVHASTSYTPWPSEPGHSQMQISPENNPDHDLAQHYHQYQEPGNYYDLPSSYNQMFHHSPSRSFNEVLHGEFAGPTEEVAPGTPGSELIMPDFNAYEYLSPWNEPGYEQNTLGFPTIHQESAEHVQAPPSHFDSTNLFSNSAFNSVNRPYSNDGWHQAPHFTNIENMQESGPTTDHSWPLPHMENMAYQPRPTYPLRTEINSQIGNHSQDSNSILTSQPRKGFQMVFTKEVFTNLGHPGDQFEQFEKVIDRIIANDPNGVFQITRERQKNLRVPLPGSVKDLLKEAAVNKFIKQISTWKTIYEDKLDVSFQALNAVLNKILSDEKIKFQDATLEGIYRLPVLYMYFVDMIMTIVPLSSQGEPEKILHLRSAFENFKAFFQDGLSAEKYSTTIFRPYKRANPKSQRKGFNKIHIDPLSNAWRYLNQWIFSHPTYNPFFIDNMEHGINFETWKRFFNLCFCFSIDSLTSQAMKHIENCSK